MVDYWDTNGEGPPSWMIPNTIRGNFFTRKRPNGPIWGPMPS